MKKRLLAGMLACTMLLGAAACAESVEDRLEHLLSHGKREVFSCSGRLVKLRVAPAANHMNGRTVMGEEFTILDTFGEWVHVEIVKTLPGNEDARRGMTGWIHVDHIACACDLEAEQESESDQESK